jgi:hypothetical protein
VAPLALLQLRSTGSYLITLVIKKLGFAGSVRVF